MVFFQSDDKHGEVLMSFNFLEFLISYLDLTRFSKQNSKL